MSAIARFLQIQFEMGKVNAEQLQGLVGGKITQEELDEITGGNEM